jgi:hypothetical protein
MEGSESALKTARADPFCDDLRIRHGQAFTKALEAVPGALFNLCHHSRARPFGG